MSVMKYLFDGYSFDPEKFELKDCGTLVAIEPQVFALLGLLIENRGRMVSKDEIAAEVWDNKIASDASIANRIKLARNAIGDDGNRQKSIRTIHGKGFRFVAETTVAETGAGLERRVQSVSENTPRVGGMQAEEQTKGHTKGTKPSIAILPFQFLGPTDPKSILTEAIPHDLIQALSRLRWMFVIARGSSFRFRSTVNEPQAIGAALGVKYVLTGSVENHGQELIITTELSDTRTGGAIWGERFTAKHDDVHQIRMEIIAKVIASLEVYIPLNEAQAARLNVSENLDSWSNYHLGIQHMYRFTKNDNEKAASYFKVATMQDPGFARAHAGLSFTSFQNAFLRYGGKQKDALLEMRRYAERSIELDPLDPFANFNMGRAVMLQGDLASSAYWLDKAIALSPNYSQGHYSHAFSTMLAGKTENSLPHYDTALALSPLDPFVYAMLAGRSLSLVIDGDYAQAAEAGERAAHAPGAHYIVDMIALIGHSLNEDPAKAQVWADKIRKHRPDANQSLFFASFPFSKSSIKDRLSDALGRYGF